jgi:hypothetical protein
MTVIGYPLATHNTIDFSTDDRQRHLSQPECGSRRENLIFEVLIRGWVKAKKVAQNVPKDSTRILTH